MSETKPLTEKLIEIQKELKAPKSRYNSFGKYNYRSVEDIMDGVKPLNAEQGLMLTLSDEPVLIGDWHYIKATATITDGKEDVTVTAYARESQTKKGMDDSQITGTASSYARKYALNGLYLIDDTKDADTDEYQKQQRGQHNNNRSQQSAPKKATNKEIGELKEVIGVFVELMKKKGKDVTPEQVRDQLGITDFTKLNQIDVQSAKERIRKWSQ